MKDRMSGFPPPASRRLPYPGCKAPRRLFVTLSLLSILVGMCHDGWAQSKGSGVDVRDVRDVPARIEPPSPPRISTPMPEAEPKSPVERPSPQPGVLSQEIRWEMDGYNGTYLGETAGTGEDRAPHGTGLWTNRRAKTSFSGSWVHGKREGKGVCLLTRGRAWKGTWHDDRPAGLGTLLSRQGMTLAPQIGFEDAKAWQPTSVAEACAILDGAPADLEAMAIVDAQETRLLNVELRSLDHVQACAAFLEEVAKSGKVAQRPAVRTLESTLLKRVDSLMRKYCSPPSFKLQNAKALAGAAGKLGEAWKRLLVQIRPEDKTGAIETDLPSKDRSILADVADEGVWGPYGTALAKLVERLDHPSQGDVVLEAGGLTEEECRQLWAGWRNTRARLKVDPAAAQGLLVPGWPVVTWAETPSPGESVEFQKQVLPADVREPMTVKLPWGNELTYRVKKGDVVFEPTLRLDPPGTDSMLDPVGCLAALIGVRGLTREDAERRVAAWMEGGYLNEALKARAQELLKARSTVAIGRDTGGTHWPCLTLSLVEGEKIAWPGSSQATKLPPMTPGTAVLKGVKWGGAIKCRLTNVAGIVEDRDVDVVPPGPVGRRMADLLNLQGLQANKARDVVEKWKDALDGTLLEEARAVVAEGGQCVLKEGQDGCHWPEVKMDGTNVAAVVWSLPDGMKYSSRGAQGVELKGVKWGERVDYEMTNRWGVWDRRAFVVDPASARDLLPGGGIDWSQIGVQRKEMKAHVTERWLGELEVFLRQQLIPDLSQALEDPAHSLWRIDQAVSVDGVKLGLVAALLNREKELQNIDTAMVQGASRTKFKYNDKNEAIGQETVTTYRDRTEGVNDALRKVATGLWEEARTCPQDVQKVVQSWILAKLMERARALKDGLPSSVSPDARRPHVEPFVGLCQDFRKKKILPEGPGSEDPVRLVSESPK